MPADLETLQRRRDKAPDRFFRGFVVAIVGIGAGIGAMCATPAFQHGPGRGETATLEQEAQMKAPITLPEKIILIGGGVLAAVGAEEMGFGAFELSDVYDDKIKVARAHMQQPAPPAAA